MRELKHLSEIFENYDTFVIDLWGVMHNGVALNSKAIDAINQLNVLRFKGLEDADSSWIKSVQSYFASSDMESSEISNIVEMIDQSGSDYYYQLLIASQRLRELDQNLDIQLMSYSLSVLANHALDRMLTNRETREALSQTLSEQIEQLLSPHLK